MHTPGSPATFSDKTLNLPVVVAARPGEMRKARPNRVYMAEVKIPKVKDQDSVMFI